MLVAAVDGAFLIGGRDGVDGHRSRDGIHDAGATDAGKTAAGGNGRRREARQNAFELLAEVVVEPGVEENVVAGGGHGYCVSQEAVGKEEETRELINPYPETKGDYGRL